MKYIVMGNGAIIHINSRTTDGAINNRVIERFMNLSLIIVSGVFRWMEGEGLWPSPNTRA